MFESHTLLTTESLLIQQVEGTDDFLARIENKTEETLKVHTGDTDSDEYDIVIEPKGVVTIPITDRGKSQVEAIRTGNYYWTTIQ